GRARTSSGRRWEESKARMVIGTWSVLVFRLTRMPKSWQADSSDARRQAPENKEQKIYVKRHTGTYRCAVSISISCSESSGTWHLASTTADSLRIQCGPHTLPRS